MKFSLVLSPYVVFQRHDYKGYPPSPKIIYDHRASPVPPNVIL